MSWVGLLAAGSAITRGRRPGRPGSWRWLPLACAGIALLACSGVSQLPRGFGRLWDDYRELPDQRALAVAGDPEGLWVAGATGGHASRPAAREAAIAECERRRRVRRVVALCRLYAVGDRKLRAD